MMPSHVETPSRIISRTVGKSTVRSRVLSQNHDTLHFQLGRNNYPDNSTDQSLKPSAMASSTLGHSRLHQDFRTGSFIKKSVTSRTFGLQAWNHGSLTETVSHSEHVNLNQDDMNHKNTMPSVSRTFNLMSENLSSVNTETNEILNLEKRRNNSINSFIPRTFGLQSRNLTINSNRFPGNDLRGNSDFVNFRKNNTEKLSMSKGFLGSERVGVGLSEPKNGGFSQDLRSCGSVNSSLVSRPFGNQLKTGFGHSGFLAEGSSRLNQDFNYKSSNLSSFQNFQPEMRDSSLAAESHIRSSVKCNSDLNDNSRFKRPTLSRVIRGRSSVLSTRLFNNQNMERHCRDLSNINGFNVSHISRREMDTLSESRLAMNMRTNWMDNQSIAGSTVSGVSMKAQFMNLLENLHHSILSIGPHMTAEAVRMEFDKAKQGLENISEMSFVPSGRDLDSASVISHSSKFNCPPVNESARVNVINGGSLHLKSSKELLKSLISSRENQNEKSHLSTRPDDRRGNIARRECSEELSSDDEEITQILFKKPKPLSKKKKSACNTKIKTSKGGSNSISEKTKPLSLRQWYPVAFGSDLAFCGIDERGASVKTEPVKKRLNSRSVELVNGLCCNLIGSPSTMVTVLPGKIASLLKNGLTDRWRVLQKELLNCQTAAKENRKREARTTPIASSPRKTTPKSTPKGSKSKQKSPKVVSSPRKIERNSGKKKLKSSKKASPKKNQKVAETLTRSGRIVKPPTMFWLVLGKGEINSGHESTPFEVPSEKTYNTSTEKPTKTPKKQNKKAGKDSAAEKTKRRSASPVKAKTPLDESVLTTSPRKSPKVKTPKGSQKKVRREVKANAKEDAKQCHSRGKRKREGIGDSDSVQAKKSKLDKKLEVEVETAVEETKSSKKGTKKKSKITLCAKSPKPKTKKSPGKKSKKESKKKATKELESEGKKELNELEDDFELQLDDIEIPEIANVSGNPKLSRSQLRVVSMETPPLKYFNSNLRLLGSSTPMRSPDWCISQRTESEVKRFQKRREEAFKKKTKTVVTKTIQTEKTIKAVQNKDLKRVMEWVAEKTVKSPVWKSKVLQYVIPSRRQMEQEDDDAEEDDIVETDY